MRARRMLARTLPPSDQSVRGSHSNGNGNDDDNDNGASIAAAPAGVPPPIAPVIGAVYLSHAPMVKIAPSPVSPLAGLITSTHRVQAFGTTASPLAVSSPAAVAMRNRNAPGSNNDDGNGIPPVTTLTNSDSSRHRPPPSPLGSNSASSPIPLSLSSPVPSSPRALSSPPSRGHAPMIVVMNDGVRRTLLRNVILLSTCGGVISMLQAGLYLWLGLSSDHSSAQTRIILSMCVTPLNCIWAALLIATYWIPKRQLPKRVYHHAANDGVDSNNDSGVNESL